MAKRGNRNEDGLRVLHRIFPNVGEEFKVRFSLSIDGVHNTLTTTGVRTDNGWQILIPPAVFQRVSKRLEDGELEILRSHPDKDYGNWLNELQFECAKWAENPSSGRKVERTRAALLISAANRAPGFRTIQRDVYNTFQVKLEDRFVYVNDSRVAARAPNKIGSSVAQHEHQLESPPISSIKQHSFITKFTHSQNVVLEGVPGTGKTYAIQLLTNENLRAGGIESRNLAAIAIRFMTMHPSTSYEDFVEGLRPAGGTPHTSSSSVRVSSHENWFFKPFDAPKSGFTVKNGFFVDACVHAVTNPSTAVIVVLDELNRCNIPKVLGDLMTVIEESKRAHWNGAAWVVDSPTKAVTLPYSGRKLFVPDNLFIVGTMNTTDRSVAPMDAALRRRFAFHRVWPQGFGPDAATTELELQKRLGDAPEMTRSLVLWKAINAQLLAKYGADAMLGHSYLDDLRAALERDPKQTREVVAYHWNHRILPQLMDVIASNGLTRSLVEDPKAFFGNDAQILASIEIAVAGSGSLRTAELRYRAS
jgi:MoxR-like ATPase